MIDVKHPRQLRRVRRDPFDDPGRPIPAGALRLAGCVLLCVVPACGPSGGADLASPAAAPASGLAGSVRRVEGVTVLTLRGRPYDRGFAHGRLMARGVVEMVDTICGTNLLLTRRGDYERVILPLVERFTFEPDDEQELRGLLDGVRAALGTEAVLQRIGRPLTLADLKAYNTAGDWYRQACSSFAAWGSHAKAGHVWVGRNFDFLPARALYTHQMIVVHERLGGKKAWAGVTAAGMIGCVTAINADGVFTSVHDAFRPLRPVGRGYAPRLLVLRRLAESCGAEDLAARALPILKARRQMFDNSILLAAAVSDGTAPAVVFEYDGDLGDGGGVTVRTAADNESKLPREMIACTNRYRKRTRPRFNLLHYRYGLMRQVLAAKTGRGLKVDFDIARKTMGAVRLPITVHTVIADLNTMDFWYAPGELLSPPGNRDFVKLPVARWLGRR